jgi:hypothetical protein
MILMKILNQEPTPPSAITSEASASIDEVVERSLRKDKHQRYASALEFGEALLTACGLTGGVTLWAERPEADLASALSSARPPPRSEPAQPTARSAAEVLASSQPSQPARPVSPAPSRPSRTSEVPMTVPTHAPKAKLIVSIAIAVAVLCLLAFLMR